MSHHVLNTVKHTLESTNTPPVLIAAGFFPVMLEHIFHKVFTLSFLQGIYFLLLIPPAGFHCWSWFKKSVLPKFKKRH